MKRTNILLAVAICFAFSASLWITAEVNAVPAFARQTGVACSTCHFQHFPALNAFGRAFKAGGFTQVGGQSLLEGDDLSIPATLNASLITKIRYQMANGKDVASTTTINESKLSKNKGELQFPDEAALFLGGRVSGNIGFSLEGALQGGDMFTSFKMPIVYDAAGAKLSIIPFTTDALGASYGFELLNTGAVRNQRAIEHRTESTAHQYLGTATAAEGIALVAYNETGFVNVSLWGPAHGTVATGFDLSHYVRVAATPNIGGWDIGAGVQYWGGKTKVGDTDNTPSQIYATEAWAVDAQAQGNVGMPLGVYLAYGTAAASKDAKNNLANGTTETSLFNANKKDKTAWSMLAELGVLPGKVTLAAGYRSGDSGAAANNQEDVITGGATYMLAQNVELQLNYSSYSGSARDKAVNTDEDNSLTTLMLFAAF